MLAPCRASTLISTACSWVNIGGQKATILAQVGPLYLGAVGQFCIGANSSWSIGFEKTILYTRQQMPLVSNTQSTPWLAA